jgi:hypothetical protein
MQQLSRSFITLLVFAGLALPAAAQVTLSEAISAPQYYERMEMPETGFVSSLRSLEIFPERVITDDSGDTVMCPGENMIAVTDIEPFAEANEVGVDGVLRMWGDYLWNHGKRSAISFPLDNGQVARWQDWAEGRRPKKHGGRFIFTQETTPNWGRWNYDQYLAFVAVQMGAIALTRESEIVFRDSLFAGDLLVSYRNNKQSWVGLVLDVVQGPRGEKLFLIGTSGAPTTTFYIMKPYSPVQGLNEWFTLDGAIWAIGDGARVDLRRVRLQ